MSFQTSIAQYFSNRKRLASELGKRNVQPPNKVLILDKLSSDVSSPDVDQNTIQEERKICHIESLRVRKLLVPILPKQPKKAAKVLTKKNEVSKSGSQLDIRRSLFSHCNKDKGIDTESDGSPREKKDKLDTEANKEIVIVPFKVKGILSPKKNSEIIVNTPEREKPESLPTKPIHKLNDLKKELGLGSVKASLSKSSRLAEIQSALEKLQKGHEKLDEISKKIPPKNPILGEFKTIQLEVPVSPHKGDISSRKLNYFKSPSKPLTASLLKESALKSPLKSSCSLLRDIAFKSPIKNDSVGGVSGVVDTGRPSYISPRKLLEQMAQLSPLKLHPPPAFEHHHSLAISDGKPALPLPYKYRALAETFRSVDTVVSIMFNRNEAIPFSKLKVSVQELSKKNLTEEHIGQIMAVLPTAFLLSQEKVRQFGSNAKSETVELVLIPNLDCCNSNGEKASGRMTPSVLLERRRKFYQTLVDMVKDYHQIFLASLQPPMEIPKEKLMRWHPEFELEGVPDVSPSSLPRPPDNEKFSTARDVLNKAKEMLLVNPRMEKALQRLSDTQGYSQAHSAKPVPALTTALKGIPKSLLEKVRARQAAKAVEMLTRNPIERKKDLEFGRLPELARILRALFVGEKKAALPISVVCSKIASSYREILSPGEIEKHLKLLIESIPGWLTIHHFEKQTFLKVDKRMDMSRVMSALNVLAGRNNF